MATGNADGSSEGRSVPMMWMMATLLTILLMVAGLYTASVNRRIDDATVIAQTTRAIVDADSQRITRLEAQYDAILKSLDRIERKMDDHTDGVGGME